MSDKSSTFMIFRPEQHSYLSITTSRRYSSYHFTYQWFTQAFSNVLLTTINGSQGLLKCPSYYLNPGTHLCQHAQILFIAHTRGPTFSDCSLLTTTDLLPVYLLVTRLSDASISMFPQFNTTGFTYKNYAAITPWFHIFLTITMPLSGHLTTTTGSFSATQQSPKGNRYLSHINVFRRSARRWTSLGINHSNWFKADGAST